MGIAQPTVSSGTVHRRPRDVRGGGIFFETVVEPTVDRGRINFIERHLADVLLAAAVLVILAVEELDELLVPIFIRREFHADMVDGAFFARA